ncbi:hypothetical protein B0H13DRAFT_1910002 [Mycena leptocephala]|nr:hypothetical protein B0H13DRAFT_1910002 [Mycena leptocephala]
MGGILGNPNAPPFMLEPARPLSRQGNPANTTWGAPEPVRPPSRQMGGILGNPNVQQFMVEPAHPLSRQGNPANTAWGALEPARPQSRQGGMLGNRQCGLGRATLAYDGACTASESPRKCRQRRVGCTSESNWRCTRLKLDARRPVRLWADLGTRDADCTTSRLRSFPNTAAVMPHFPQPTRPLLFMGGDTVRSTTPRPIYGPPAATAAFGTGYPAQTPGVAAGYPLPASRSNSTATITPHQRLTNLNAGTTPAAFNTRPPTSRPGSRASSRGTSASGFTRYSNNQTPNPNANLGITNPYTSILEEEPPPSGSTGSSLGLPRMTLIDRMTANNTFANATASYTGAPVIPPIPMPIP